jgi:uncharacterized membrane-anchored protein
MKGFVTALSALALSCASTMVTAQDNALSKLPWQMGPQTVHLGNEATLNVPQNCGFLDPSGTRQYNEIAQNPPTNTTEYTFSCGEWVAFFSYEATGYVKDENDIDADAILANIRQGTAAANVERRSRGWGEMKIVGWSSRPQYDSQFKSLTWSILGEDVNSQQKIANYNARLLGRSGVTSVVMVSDPSTLNQSIDEFRERVKGFEYAPGETYGEYKAGDHVAAYGLAALITGGAAAVAAKKGLFAVIGGFLVAAWKFVIAGIFALSAWFKSLFKKK